MMSPTPLLESTEVHREKGQQWCNLMNSKGMYVQCTLKGDTFLRGGGPRCHGVHFWIPPISPSILGSKSLFLTRPSLVAHTSTREELLQRANDVLGWVADNTLNLRIHNTFQLSDAEEAHRQLEGRISTGKIIMKP